MTFVRGGVAQTIRANAAVLACWNSVIPHLCPEMPAAQREALAYGAKVPLLYANVALRNWQAFQRLGVLELMCPGAYWSRVSLDFPVSFGGVEFSRSPDEPIIVQLLRAPCRAGLPPREQLRAGRYELLSTPFATFKANIRDQLTRMLAAGGFDADATIAGITVNRWPHGYAYEYNPLFDGPWPAGKEPCVTARQPFGSITIANSDSGAFAYAQGAFDQAWRAVSELPQS